MSRPGRHCGGSSAEEISCGALGLHREELACRAASGVIETSNRCKEETGMKWCRFRIGQQVSYGIMEDEARVTAAPVLT